MPNTTHLVCCRSIGAETIYAKSHEEARRKLAQAIAERDKGLVYDSGNVTVSEYLQRWLEDPCVAASR
jgi:hypothetical protein